MTDPLRLVQPACLLVASDPAPSSHRTLTVRLVFIGIILVCAIAWALKNRFTDYP